MPRSSRDTLVLAALVVLGAAVRVALARGDLWLDELWSLSFARQITWPWEVLTAIHHDNNHPLNTLALYLTVTVAGAHGPSMVYRVLPLLAGLATIPLLYWTESHKQDPVSRISGVIAAGLCASSFLAILYSSEARGYTPAAFFAVLAFAMVRTRELATGRARALFAIVIALGLLSHLTFLFVYAGLAAWTFARLVVHRRDLRGWIALHQIPLVVIVGVYLVDAGKLVYGGGPAFSVLDVVTRVLSLTAGGPDVGAQRWSAMLRTAAAAAFAIWLLVRARNDEWIFFVTSLLVAPALMFLVYEPRFLDVPLLLRARAVPVDPRRANAGVSDDARSGRTGLCGATTAQRHGRQRRTPDLTVARRARTLQRSDRDDGEPHFRRTGDRWQRSRLPQSHGDRLLRRGASVGQIDRLHLRRTAWPLVAPNGI